MFKTLNVRRLVDYEEDSPSGSKATTPVRQPPAEANGTASNGHSTPHRRPLLQENGHPRVDVRANGSSSADNNENRPAAPQSSPNPPQNGRPKDVPNGHSTESNRESNGRSNGHSNVLPVQEHMEKIVGAIFDHATTIFVGETGSGKSTLIPQFVLDHIVRKGEQVAVTQPRRVAAFSLAKKVADDRRVELGQEVGYKFRFENATTPKTRLTYMTDGMLLKEFASNPRLSQYSCIVLDEVHERSMASDVLLFVLRRIQRERPKKLKLVLMSATIDAEKLREYFDGAPAFSIPGRTFPVRIFYTQMTPTEFEQDGHADLALRTVRQLHELQPLEESFLVFLTGQDEIEGVCRALRQEMNENPKPMRVVPFYAQAKGEDVQKTVFAVVRNARKVVAATNIAETSITIPDIKVVIDGGKVKQKVYRPGQRTNSLAVVPTSRSQAIQRAGRAGRVSPGCCFRLYTKADYERMETDVVPEIKRSNLSEVLMNLIAVGLKTPARIQLLDNPTAAEWAHALDELFLLELIAFSAPPNGDSLTKETFVHAEVEKKMELEYELTERGRTIRRLPVSPMLGRFLHACYERHCLVEGLIVAACCSVEDFAVREELLDEKTREEHRRLMKTCAAANSDHVRLVRLYRHFKKQNGNLAKEWCERSGLHFRRLEEIHRIRGQLRDECAKLGWNQDHDSQSGQQPKEDLLKLALAESHFVNAAFLNTQMKFHLTSDKSVPLGIHPTSSLRGSFPSAFVFGELLQTSSLPAARIVTMVDKQLLKKELARFGLLK
ncbi:putative ATP-dependent RNA helicase DHX33 [Aphelenchoides fujianensis]|nr:putative ATP-dependent RNA helicase DHX33 [Aphelenchoides fujianensis]